MPFRQVGKWAERMTEDEKYQQGLATRRTILGNAWVDKSLANLNDFNAEFQNFISRYVWGEIWTRPGKCWPSRSRR